MATDVLIPKIVVDFTLDNTEKIVRTKIKKEIIPKLETVMDKLLTDEFKTGAKKESKLIISKQGKRFQLYPKMAVLGETKRNKQLRNKEVSNKLASFKSILRTQLEKISATDIKFHIHYRDGRRLEEDEY